MSDPAALLPDVLSIVAKSGDLVREQARMPREIRKKGRIDLVTATDVAVEELLCRELAALLPGSTFLAEESAPGTLPGPNTWIIDPLDGTTNFAHGFPFVCTSVALWDGREPVLGVVSAPLLGETFAATRGGGAMANGQAMAASETSELIDALVATGFPYAIEANLPEILTHLRAVLLATRGIRRPGSAALDLAYVAMGRFDAFYEMGLHPWDVAAGWLLVTEAGGAVCQYDPAAPYALGARTILAHNGRLGPAMLDLLRPGAPA